MKNPFKISVLILAAVDVLPCCELLTVWLDGSVSTNSPVDASSCSSSVELPPPSWLHSLTFFFLFSCFLCSSLVLFVFFFNAFPPARFVHAARCAQTRALLRNAGLALASTNKRTGAAPAGGYQNIHPTNSIRRTHSSNNVSDLSSMCPSVHHFPLMVSWQCKDFSRQTCSKRR